MSSSNDRVFYVVFGRKEKEEFLVGELAPAIKEFPHEKWQESVKFAYKLMDRGYLDVTIKEFLISNILRFPNKERKKAEAKAKSE